MPRPKLSQEELDRTRDRILDTATEIFAMQGFAGAGLRQIANEADVHTHQLYQFFPDKQSLYDSCCARIFTKNRERVAEACAPFPDPAGKLRAFVHTLCDVMFNDDTTARLFHRQLLDHDLEGMDAMTGHAYQAEFDQLVKWIVAITGPENADLKAYSIYALATGMIHQRIQMSISGREIAVLSHPDSIADYVLRTLIPEACVPHG